MSVKPKKAKNKYLICLEYMVFRILLGIVAVIPERLLYRLMRGFFRLGYWFDVRHRERSVRHMLHAGIVANRAEALALTRKVFDHFANILCDIGTSRRHLKPERIDEIIAVSGEPEVITPMIERDAQGRYGQCIIATAHYGNWEVAGSLYAWLSKRKMVSVMRPLDNPLIGDYIYNQRQSGEHTIISKNGALKRLLLAVKQGETICLVVDQHAAKSEGVEVTFFGKPVSMHASLAKLHLKTGLPIVLGACRRLDDSHHYTFDITAYIRYAPTGDEEADIKAISQQYMNGLEKMVRIAPEQWLWPHRRFLDLRHADWLEKKRKREEKEGKKV